MPTVVNGIGTWYYGKRRLHRLKGVCGFCGGVGDLESYDTTLFFVVLFIPLLPLGKKRILEKCPSCQQHRALPLKEWEAHKAQDIDRLLARLQENPDDRDTILEALALAASYQDEPLLDKLAPALAQHRRDDAAIQAQLGAAYSYFGRRTEAEAAYRNSLAVADDPRVREMLGLCLIKQGRPDEAAPYLAHIITQKDADQVGLIYLLVEAYQAQGMHTDALELMDCRDTAFPQLAKDKDCLTQRRTSERYQHTGQKVRSALLSESGTVGYKEGGWTARLPWLIAPALLLIALAVYLGVAIWKGQSRKVYLVNGLNRPYTVSINGKEQSLQPGATPVNLPEGEVVIEFPGGGQEPIRCKIETPFFSRPFTSYTFAINPDRVAFLVEDEAECAEIPRPPTKPPQLHGGEVLYSFKGLDYEFAEFPHSVQTKKGQTIRKTRVGLAPAPTALDRYRRALQLENEYQQFEYARQLLLQEPDDPYFPFLLIRSGRDQEALAFLEAGLTARPVRVDWHRGYQTLIETNDRQRDLRPQYRRLVDETKGHPDAVFLLARVEDLDTSDKLLQQAAGANPPSAYALHSLGFWALAQGQHAEAVNWMQRACKAFPDYPNRKEHYWAALLATGQYERVLEEVRSKPQDWAAALPFWTAQVQAYAGKRDRNRAQSAVDEAVQPFFGPDTAPLGKFLRAWLEIQLCCWEGDVAGFLKRQEDTPRAWDCQARLLRNNLHEAAGMVMEKHLEEAEIGHGLVYLAALKHGEQKLADEEFQKLMAALDRDDRHTRQLAEILAGRKPVDMGLITRLPIDAREKRVLVTVAARRFPDKAEELLRFARTLDFHRDPTSLCLRQILDGP
jgi:tetratricopeptide (TPR) repeat protein